VSDWIDVTLPIRSRMVVWPGDPDIVVERVLDIDRGDEVNVSRLQLNSHCGTHMDAPLHYLKDGAGVDQAPLEVLVGPARVVQISNSDAVTAAECQGLNPQPGERILFRTHNSEIGYDTPFREDFTYIAHDAAQLLAEKKLALVGIDYMSVGGFTKDGTATHEALLGSGIWVVENLDLTCVEPGNYEMICLPLRIENCDGAPCRVLLRPV